MRKSLLLFKTCLLLFVTGQVFSQNDEKSTLIGNPTDNERAINICADPAGNSYTGGRSNQKGLIIKQNALHITQWSKTLSFTQNPADEVSIGFLDVIGDTVFGCGKITESLSQIGVGSFYFKMNAQTGALYWSKYEISDENYLSCMRYSNGKFYLVGGSIGAGNFRGRVMAVSSQTGQIIWQTPQLSGFDGASSGPANFRTSFISATEMVNGKIYITGTLTNLLHHTQPILVGIDMNGTVFLRKIINVAAATPFYNEYFGMRIEYDQDQNLILEVGDNLLTSAGNLHSFLIKCDTLGILIFAKEYSLPANFTSLVTSINETSDSYVMFGFYLVGSINRLFAVKVFKDGTYDKSISIIKPNIGNLPPLGYDRITGNSSFINGKHYFVMTESAYSVYNTDIHQIILDEDLNLIDDCSETPLLSLITSDVSVPMTQMNIAMNTLPLVFSNGVLLEDLVLNELCDGISLDLVQNTTCNQAIIEANTAGFTDPTFYWSNGTSGMTDSIIVNTTDTVFVRVLDTKCCELIDTIVPVLSTSAFQVNLPNDTTICLQNGTPFSIIPSVSGANGTVQYLWSTNSTTPSISVTQSGTYWVEVTDQCQTLSDSIVVTVNSLPVIGNGAAITVCEGDFPVVLSPTVSSGATVLWEDGVTTTATRTVTGPGIYTISATNDCGTVTASIPVSQTTLPTVELNPLIDTCIQSGGGIPLVAVVANASAVIWSEGSSGNQLLVSNSGTYTVYASNSCGIDSANCSVTIRYFPELDLPAVLDTCFEAGVGFSYTAQGSGGSYQWSSGSNSATEWISQEGIYTCTLSNSCGSISDSMQVRRFTEVDLFFPEDSIRDCQKQLSVSLLHAETNYTLEIFAPNGDLVGTHIYESGWYRLHAYNPCAEVWDSIYVNLQNELLFYLPNSFTPNGDLHNDRFEFSGENIAIRDVRIFNRWGEEVYTEKGTFEGWDGTYRGEKCPDGIYSVHLIYEDCFGIPTEFNGHVNLLR